MSDIPKELSKRQQKALRILDAASELIQRWGYNKTTMDDIARQADVAKGTLYLYWKTREALFQTLMNRERVEHARDFNQRISQDPQGATLRGLFKHSALALLKRPLLRALFLRDMDVIGKLAADEQSRISYVERLAGFKHYLAFLREHQQVRSNLSLEQQTVMVSAIFTGFFITGSLLPTELAMSDEQMVELMVETIHCTLETRRAIRPKEIRAINGTFLAYLTQAVAAAEAQFFHELAA